MLECFKKFIPEDFFIWMNSFFKIFGLLPPKSPKMKILYLLITIPHFCSTMFLGTCSEFTELLLFFDKDFKVFMLTLSLCVLHMIIIFRIVFWFFTKEKLDMVKKVIQRDSFEFKCFSIYKISHTGVFKKAKIDQAKENTLDGDDFQKFWSYAEIFINDKKNRIEQLRKERMALTRMLCCGFYLGINFITMATIGASYINILATEEFEAFNAKLNVTSTYRLYPYHMYLPFDTSISHGYYWQGYIYQIYVYCSIIYTFLHQTIKYKPPTTIKLTLTVESMTFSAIDTIITNSIIHIINQTIILAQAFSGVEENIDYTQSREKVLLLQEIRIVKCITELQEIYKAVYLLEDLCHVQLLIQYGASVFILCSLCYIIPLVNNVGEFICSLVFLLATLGEIFIFTYCSQTLSLELQNVAVPVYNLNWQNYPPKLRKKLVFLIDRLQKPCVLTAGKIINLDLLFFIQVTQTAYSFYTLISNTSK